MRTIAGFVLLILLTLCLVSPVNADEEPPVIYYVGPEGPVKTALDLTKFPYTDDITAADVIVLNGKIPNAKTVAAQMRSGTGVLLIMGPSIRPEEVSALLGSQVLFENASEPVTLKQAEGVSFESLKNILWNTAPQVRERIHLTSPSGGIPPDLTPIVLSLETGDAIVSSVSYDQKHLFILEPILGTENQQFRDWGYFNYLIYTLSSQSAGQNPLSYADYPASPVPHPSERMGLYLMMGLLMLTAVAAFWIVRRYSLAHPEALDTLVRDPQSFTAREAGTDWEKIGFHRPLGGFMFALMMGIFLFIPLAVYQDMILPVYILPSADAMGIYGRVAAFFPIVWGVFDMGTSVAHMKFFSEYRVHNPRRAVQYAQFYVWWQALSGAVQVALVIAVAGTFMPKSAYALYTWVVITHALIQIPGFFRLFTNAFSGIQRSDYGTILDMGINMVFPMIAQPICVGLMVWWGGNHAAFGPTMGGVIGLGLAAYFTELMAFVFGWYLYRRLGYNGSLLMMAHFDKSVALDSLKFGVFIFLSSLIGGAGSSINVLVIQNRLLNNNEILGNIGLAGSFIFAYTVFQALTGAMMPSISEAVSNRRKILAQYYATNGYKFGGMVSGFICSIMLAVADRFIIGSSGQSFQRAAIYVIPMLISGAMSFATWNADSIMYGSGKTRLVTLLALVDLFLGISLAYVLVDRFQVYGLLAVPFITVPVRAVLGYYLNNRYCFPQRFFIWQTVAAPLLAGIAHFLIVRGITGLIWQENELTSIFILVIALIPSFPIYAFLYGFFGGWDFNTLEVFDRATMLSSFMRPFTRLFYHATALGARFSPLHNRFPISIHNLAMSEADSLSAERVSLLTTGHKSIKG